MKNHLLEAAAEILKSSAASAPRMELEKPDGEVQDLGGDTPTKHSEDKLDVRAKEATPPGKQPGSETKAPLEKLSEEEEGEQLDEISAGLSRRYMDKSTEDLMSRASDRADSKASGRGAKEVILNPKRDYSTNDKKMKDRFKGIQRAGRKLYEEEDAEDLEEMHEEWKKSLKEDVAAIIASETDLPKEFSTKIGTIYEARVTDKVQSIQESIEAEYADKFTAAVIEVRTELTEQVNDYLDYVVEEWMKQNELAIEKGLRSELTEEFIGGLRNLFLEHYIDIPSEKVDLVDELATKVEELTGSLNEEVSKNVDLKKQLGEAKKSEILQSVCEGLTQTQVEKVRTLAESVEFTADGDYTGKVSTIRENYFPVATGKKIDVKVLTEASEPLDEAKAPVVDADVARVAAAIQATLK